MNLFRRKSKSYSNSTPIGQDISSATWLSSMLWGMSKSSVSVDPDNSKSISSYFACLRVISEDLAKLPIELYTYNGRMKKRAAEEVSYVMNCEFNPYTTAINGRATLTSHALGWGVGAAEIQRNGLGQVVALYIIHPSRLSYTQDEKGVITWYVACDDNNKVAINDRNIFRICGLGDDGIWGDTPAKVGRDSLGISLAQQEYNSGFYANGAALSGIITSEQMVKEDTANKIRREWASIYGGPSNAHKIAVIDRTMKYTPVSIAPRDAQFIESISFQIEEVCRWFRVSPMKIGHVAKVTNNNFEQESINHATDTLHPWAVRWEQEIEKKLVDRRNTEIEASVQFKELLRGDNKSRSEYYKNLFDIGAMSPNDVRQAEDMNPRDDKTGDDYYIPVNMMAEKEREKWQGQKQAGETVKMKAVSNILEPFAQKESKAQAKNAVTGKNMLDFFNRNAQQMGHALHGVIDDISIDKGVSAYLKYPGRISGIISEARTKDDILAELMNIFEAVNDNI